MRAAEETKSTRQTKNQYYLADGTPVPGVTTVLGHRGKSEGLVNWAFRIGQRFPDLRSLDDYVDDLAHIGTLAHSIIDASVRGVKPDLMDFTPNEIAAARNCVAKYDEWAFGKNVTFIASDLALVSEEHRFGGKLDYYAYVNGVPTVIDFKTGRYIYESALVQTAAYAELLRENIARGNLDLPFPVALCVLQIGRVADEDFSVKARTSWDKEFRYFLALLASHNAHKEMKSRA